MGIEALLSRDDGTPIAVPVSPGDWQPWVSAGRTRNWMLNDPFLDWLQLYGKSRGYIPDNKLDGYEKNLDFLAFLVERGNAFEAGILQWLKTHHEVIPSRAAAFAQSQAGTPKHLLARGTVTQPDSRKP